MPPLPLVAEDRLPPPIRITQRVTMDFSLLSVPLPDLLQGSNNQEENIQVFSVTFRDCNSLFTVVQMSAYLLFADLFKITVVCGCLYNMCKILPKSFSECPKQGSVRAFTAREAE